MLNRLWILTAVSALIAVNATAAAERVTASGRVVGPDGKPVERATVFVYEARTKHGYSVYCPTCWVDCGKRTTTDASGTYSISGLDPDLVFKLLIVRSGYRTLFLDKVDPSKGTAEDVLLKPESVAADPSQTVRGRIVDDHGNPIADAVVEQQGITFKGPRGLGRSFGPDDSPDWIQPLAATDEHGEFEIAYAKPAVEITLDVSPRAMAPKLVTLPTGPERKTISVAQGATLRGRLLQPDRKPASNAEIGVFAHARAAGTAFPELRIGTKEDGTFTLTNVPAGRIWYVYPKMESLAARGLAGPAITVETKSDGEDLNIGIMNLQRAYALKGKIQLSDSKPIPPNMHVTLSSDAGLDNQIAAVGEDGSFEFGGLLKAVYSISPAVRGYKPKDDFYGEVFIDRDEKSIVVSLTPAAPH